MAHGKPVLSCPTVNQLYRALKDSSVDRKVLLTCMGVEPSKIREFKRGNYGNEDGAFMDTLEYFLKNNCSEEGQEWHVIVDALQVNNDMKTAETIRRQYVATELECMNSLTVQKKDEEKEEEEEGEEENEEKFSGDGYCTFSPNHTEEMKRKKRIEYLEKMKIKVITEYSGATKNIEDSYYNVNRTLETEHNEMKRALISHKQKMMRGHDKYEKEFQDLTDRTVTNHKNVQDTISRLSHGDCTGIATLEECKSELVSLERYVQRGSKNIERFKRHIPKTYSPRITTRDSVIEELQQVLLLDTWPCSNIDEEEYVNMSDILLRDNK